MSVTRSFRLYASIGILFFILIFPVGAQERELMLDASTLSPSSPYQWQFSGIRTSKGSVGNTEMSLDPQGTQASADLSLEFNEDLITDTAGGWSASVEGTIGIVGKEQARFGTGAVSFRAPQGKIIVKPIRSDVFGSTHPAGDFTIEFWLKPTRADNGEIIFLWKSSKQAGKTWISQQASCLIVRNRLTFGFLNFFADPSGKETSVSLQGKSLLVPSRWSHHCLRFDSSTGLLEYLMDGIPEAVTFATSTGKEGSTVFPAVAGSSSHLDIGPNYTGLMDNFRILPFFLEDSENSKYPRHGGLAISPIYDIGWTNSHILQIDLSARLGAESAIQASYRVADTSVGWTDEYPKWIPYSSGKPLGQDSALVSGRYVQLRFSLYPDATQEVSPVVAGIRILYEPDYPPQPPSTVFALPGNERILVRWTPVTEADVRGYAVYYGIAPGNYYGTDAVEGPSPIAVSDPTQTSVTLTGLANGTLYFIAVVAIDAADPPHAGEFSREVNARPSRVR